MILPREEVAWIRLGDGSLVPFEESRLRASIDRAATACGQTDSLLADSVTAAVQLFVAEGTGTSTIALGELAEVVEAALALLGHEDVSAAYARRHHRTEIRLDELARADGAEWELAFYRRLDQALGVVADHRLAFMEVRGLRACVMRLCGARRWGQDCRRLAEEIVHHLRERVRQSRDREAPDLQMAVYD